MTTRTLLLGAVLAVTGCAGPPSPTADRLEVGASGAIHTYLSVANPFVMSRMVLTALGEQGTPTFWLQVAPETVLNETTGALAYLGGTETVVGLQTLDASFEAADTLLALHAYLGPLALTVSLDLVGAPPCDVTWTVNTPRLDLQLDAARDKTGHIQVFPSSVPKVYIADTSFDASKCEALGFLLPKPLEQAVRSKLMAATMQQLAGVVGGALTSAAAEALGVALPGAGTLLLPGGAESLAYDVTSASTTAEADPIEVVGGQVSSRYDLGLQSTLSPCVPPAEPPGAVATAAPDPALVSKLARDHVVVLAIDALRLAATHLYRSGALCARTAPGQVGTAGDWAATIPGLGAFGQDPALRLDVRPGAPPELFLAAPGEEGQAALEMRLPGVAIDVYTVIDATPVRLYTARADAAVRLSPSVDATGRWRLALDGATATDASWSSPVPIAPPLHPDEAAAALVEAVFATLAEPVVWAQVPLPVGPGFVPKGVWALGDTYLGAAFDLLPPLGP